MKTFVTSDTHFLHSNIIKYCSRPFNNVDEMDTALITIWNEIIAPEDIVFHLGDFAMGGNFKLEQILKILNSLNGKKILVRGNHDHSKVAAAECWKKVCKEFNFEFKGIKIHMQHVPWKDINPEHLYLHGHSHGTLGTWHDGQIDVGVDCWDFAPVELDEIIEFWESNRNHSTL